MKVKIDLPPELFNHWSDDKHKNAMKTDQAQFVNCKTWHSYLNHILSYMYLLMKIIMIKIIFYNIFIIYYNTIIIYVYYNDIIIKNNVFWRASRGLARNPGASTRGERFTVRKLLALEARLLWLSLWFLMENSPKDYILRL